MLKADAETILLNWWTGSGKVFRYKREFMFDEFILIYKRGEMFVVDQTSTYQIKDMDSAGLISMLQRGELIYFGEPRFGETCRDIKTGGCDCGWWWKPGA